MELSIDLGGFGVDEAAVAPVTVGNFVDKVELEGGFWFEFIDECGDQQVVLGLIFFQVGGVDDDVDGVEAVSRGVLAGGFFAFVGDGTGGFLSVFLISFCLFFAGGHRFSLLFIGVERYFGGKLWGNC